MRDKPPLRCLASLSHTLYLPSLLLPLFWWRHSILPPLALAPLALSHHSAAGLTGSDVCQRLFFSSQAPEVRAAAEKGFSQVKYDLFIATEHLGRKMLMWDELMSHLKDLQAYISLDPTCSMEIPLKDPIFLSLRAEIFYITRQRLCFVVFVSSFCQTRLVEKQMDTGNIPVTALLHVLHAAHQHKRSPCF